jgi:hypothetical protein
MSILGLGSNLLTNPGLASNPAVAVRLLAGSLPVLRVGEQVLATVVKSSPGQLILDLHGATLLAEGLPVYLEGTQIPVKVAAYAPGPVLEFDTSAASKGAAPTGPSITPRIAGAGTRPVGIANQNQPTQQGSPALIANPGIARYSAASITRTPISADQLPLQIGQQLTAKVVDRLQSGRVIIDVQGQAVEAETPHSFAIGTRIPIEVAYVEPEVVFTILDNKPGLEAEAAKILRSNLATQEPVGSTLQDLQGLLNQLAAQNSDASLTPGLSRLKSLIESFADNQAAPSPDKTSAFVRHGGLQYEAKLGQALSKGPAALSQVAQQDLKGVLLQTVREARTSPSVATTLAEQASVHLSQIETQQALNVLARLHGEPYQFQIPFMERDQAKTAFISVSPDDHSGQPQNDDEKGFDVLVHLDLDRLGSTRIDAHFSGKSMRVLFFAENDKSVALIRSELPAFQSTLQAMGYRDVLLGAEPDNRITPEKKQRFSGLMGSVPPSVRLVDVRA